MMSSHINFIRYRGKIEMDRETILNMDPHILVSILNLKLRDFYSSLDMFCDDIDINRNELEEKLNKSGYFYQNSINQFK